MSHHGLLCFRIVCIQPVKGYKYLTVPVLRVP